MGQSRTGLERERPAPAPRGRAPRTLAHPLALPGAALIVGLAFGACDRAEGAAPERDPSTCSRPVDAAMDLNAALPLTADWSDAGDLRLSDGRRLVPAGIVLPTPLAGDSHTLDVARETARTLLDGRLVVLGATRPDRHGRLAGTATLLDPAHDETAQEDLAIALLRVGAGTAQTLPGDGACRPARLAAEAEARQEKKGIWSHPDTIVPAGDEAALAIRAGLFTVAEGRVRDVGVTRDRVFLNFGARWRQDFTAIIPTEDFATILGDSLDPAMLRGTLVRLRGVVREDGGPAMTLRRPGEIERVTGARVTGVRVKGTSEAPPPDRRGER